MNRRLRILGLIWMLCLALLPAQAFAAEEPPTVFLHSAGFPVQAGDTVTVGVEARNLTGLYGNEVRISYNAALLKYVSTKHEINGGNPITQPAEGMLTLANFFVGKAPGVSGNQTLYTVTFEARAEGDASVSIAGMKLIGTGAAAMPGTVGKGSVIKIGTPAPGQGTGTPDPEPPEPKPAAPLIVVDAAAGRDGVAVARVDPAELAAAIGAAKGKALVIDVQQAGDAREIQIKLPVRQILEAGEGKIGSITLQSALAAVTLDPSLLKGAEGGSELTLSVAKAERTALPPEVLAKLDTHAPVYDFNLSVDGKAIRSFNGGELKVAVPYPLQPGEAAHQVVLYYIAEDGRLEVVKNGKYDPATGMVEFKPKHFSKYAPAYKEVAFRDLAEHAWAKDAVLGLAAREIVQGSGGGRFVPEGRVTRAEFITMLVNAFELRQEGAVSTLTDVKEGDWYYGAVASAQRRGIVGGISPTEFGADAPITRQDMAVMIHRTVKALGWELEAKHEPFRFTDHAAIGSYAVEAVETMQQSGVIRGTDHGAFAPEVDATRAEAAVIISRLM